MPVRWTDLESAFMARDASHDARSWIHGQTGQVRVLYDGQGDGPPPADETGWHLLPDARELDLKQRLVLAFVADECPPLHEDVVRCFSRRGGWRAYKHLLADRGLLERWHRYEEAATRHVLLAWAADLGITVVDAAPEDEMPGMTH